MKILVLNGSPRQHGRTKKMISAFLEGAEPTGHQVTIIDVCHKKIAGCLACEYCHTEGNGICIQKDDMQEIYRLLQKTDMLILASPIYYHNISGQLKCTIDRFYSMAYPQKPELLKKISLFLSSGDDNMYDGALFSYYGDFINYMGLEDMGVFTVSGGERNFDQKLKEIREFGASL